MRVSLTRGLKRSVVLSKLDLTKKLLQANGQLSSCLPKQINHHDLEKADLIVGFLLARLS
jgi:hypothetical protein